MFDSVSPAVVRMHAPGSRFGSLQFLIPKEVCDNVGFNRPGAVEFIDFGNLTKQAAGARKIPFTKFSMNCIIIPL